jgi:hypothetical protein
MGDVLNQDERLRLKQCSETIHIGLKSYYEMGNAFLEIKESMLYRETHDTFLDFCRDEWGTTASFVYRTINAAKVHTNLEVAGVPTPTAKSHAEELSRLPEDEQANAWADTLKATQGKPTNSTTRSVVDSRLAKGGHSPKTGPVYVKHQVAMVPGHFEWILERAKARKISPSAYISDLIHEDRMRNVREA